MVSLKVKVLWSSISSYRNHSSVVIAHTYGKTYAIMENLSVGPPIASGLVELKDLSTEETSSLVL